MTAMESAAVGLPSMLGSALIPYAQVAPAALSAGVLAAFIGVAWVTLLTSQSSRSIAYTTRFFEAATLASLVMPIAHCLPQYGLQDTEAMRLGLLCDMSAMAGLVTGLLRLCVQSG